MLFTNIGAYNFQSSSFEIQDDDLDPIILGADSKNISDIYYIVMDEYAPLRTLDEVFDYDNSNFIEIFGRQRLLCYKKQS